MLEREKKDLAVYHDYMNLMSVPGQSKTEVVKLLMNKYGIHSPGTIYVIRHRVEEKLKKQE